MVLEVNKAIVVLQSDLTDLAELLEDLFDSSLRSVPSNSRNVDLSKSVRVGVSVVKALPLCSSLPAVIRHLQALVTNQAIAILLLACLSLALALVLLFVIVVLPLAKGIEVVVFDNWSMRILPAFWVLIFHINYLIMNNKQ